MGCSCLVICGGVQFFQPFLIKSLGAVIDDVFEMFDKRRVGKISGQLGIQAKPTVLLIKKGPDSVAFFMG